MNPNLICPATRTKVHHDNRTALRRATRQMHASAEASWAGADQGGIPIPVFLSRMLHVHACFGLSAAQLTGATDLVEHERRRLFALAQDLDLRPQSAAPSGEEYVLSRDAAWGVLYALNGSALGATVLMRDATNGAARSSAYLGLMRDFAKSGALAGFFRLLNAQDLNQNRAVDGAHAVFAALTMQNPATKDGGHV